MWIRKSKFQNLEKELADAINSNVKISNENKNLLQENDRLMALVNNYESNFKIIADNTSIEFDGEDEQLTYSATSLGTKKYEKLFKKCESTHSNHDLNVIGHDSEVYLSAIFDIIYLLDTRTNKKISVRKYIIDKLLTKDTKNYVNSEEFIKKQSNTKED